MTRKATRRQFRRTCMRLAPRFGVSARALGSGYRLEFDGATYTHESDPVLAFASVQPTTLRFRLVPKDPKQQCRRRRFNGPTRKQRTIVVLTGRQA